MMQTLITAGLRLAEALKNENEALAKLDLARAAQFTSAKMQASDAFAAAFSACSRTGAQAAEGPERQAAHQLAEHLESLGTENRRLLERAIALQARVIETIAGAAVPRATGPMGMGYGASGGRPMPRQTPAIALSARA